MLPCHCQQFRQDTVVSIDVQEQEFAGGKSEKRGELRKRQVLSVCIKSSKYMAYIHMRRRKVIFYNFLILSYACLHWMPMSLIPLFIYQQMKNLNYKIISASIQHVRTIWSPMYFYRYATKLLIVYGLEIDYFLFSTQFQKFFF